MVSIREVIVVEGRDDERAVKRAVDAAVIITRGFGLTGETIRRIAVAQRRVGVIVLTDPDHAGEQIRRRVNGSVPGCKNAYLTRDKACRNDDIGIEHAGPEDIADALMAAHCEVTTAGSGFSRRRLMAAGLMGDRGAAVRRRMLGDILGIGYANGRQFLSRLNRYGIAERQFTEALASLPAALPPVNPPDRRAPEA